MAMIKLHGTGVDEGFDAFVNSNQIIWIATDNNRIKLTDGDFFTTKETPEEILKLIEKEERSKLEIQINDITRKSTDIFKENCGHNSRVQELIDQAHAAEFIMQEKDPTYGR